MTDGSLPPGKQVTARTVYRLYPQWAEAYNQMDNTARDTPFGEQLYQPALETFDEAAVRRLMTEAVEQQDANQ